MFKKNNESFTCINCHKRVDFHPSSSRDHCNYCLYGMHVDNDPGDRSNDCRGLLEPVGLRKKGKKQQIVYTCQKCHRKVYCVLAPDDDSEELLELSLAEF